MSRPIIGRALTTRAIIARAILARGVGSEDDSFCPIQNYIGGDQNASCLITQNDFVVTSLVNTGGFSCFIFGDTITNLKGSKAWAEVQVNGADCAGCGGGVVIEVGTGKGGEIFGAIAFGFNSPGNGFIVDLTFNTIASGLTLSFGWTVQLRADGLTGDISWQDNQGNGGLVANAPDLVANQLFRFGAIGGGQGTFNIGDTVSMIMNENYFANAVPLPADYYAYCDIPARICRILGLSSVLEANSTSVITDNTVVTTGNSGVVNGVGIYSDAGISVKPNTTQWAVELTMQEPPVLVPDIFMGGGFGEDNLLAGIIGFLALGIPAGGTGIGDWEISFVDSFGGVPTPVLSNLTITFPYIVKVVYTGDNITFKDNQAVPNTGILGTVVGLSSAFGTVVVANATGIGIGNSAETKMEARKENWVIDFENDATDWCNLEGGSASDIIYEYLEFAQTGGGGYDARLAGWTTDGVNSSSWFGTSSYSVINTVPLDDFVFESVTTTIDLDAAWLGGKVTTLTNIDFGGTGDSSAIGIGTQQITLTLPETGIRIDSQDSNNDYDKNFLLFKIPTELGFVSAVGVIDRSHVRPMYKSVKETVFFDAITLRDYGVNHAPVTQLGTFGVPLVAGRTYAVTYNGKDDDLVINNYPDNFLSYQGNTLPTKTAVETKSARWLLDYILEFVEIVPTEYIDITGNTATAITTLNQFFLLNCARFINNNDPVKVAVVYSMDVTAFVSADRNAFRLELDAINRISKVAIELVGSDLVLTILTNGVSQPTQTIKANYVADTPDQLCLVMDTNTNTVKAILQQAGALDSTAYVAIDSAADVSWMPRAGHDSANGNGTLSINNQYDSNDLPAGVLRTELINETGVTDILGNFINI